MALAQEKVYTIDDIYALPDGERAELIDGKIYNMTPPKRIHQKLVAQLTKLIGNYIEAKDGDCEVYPAPFAVFLNADDKTYVEPDVSVICDKNKLDEYGCNGAPDWIVEIVSPSTSSHDYVRKLNLYMDAGVRDYWIIDPRSKRILVYHLEKTDFEVKTYTFQDRVKANIYDDLWIDFTELEL